MADMLGALQERKKSGRLRFKTMTGMQKREARWGYIFISPWLIGFTLFYIIPMIASLVFSTLDFTLSAPDEIEFVGLQNWVDMFTTDERAWDSLKITVIFGVISLPIGLISALFLAILLNSENLVGIPFFRTIFYMPTMIPVIASVFIWKQFLNIKTGWLNRMIDWVVGILPGDIAWSAAGSTGLDWLNSPTPLLYVGYTLVGLWGVGNAMLLTLAALQGVPTDLYEASRVDGAGWWRRLWNITLPMISPVIFYNLIIGAVGLFQYFLIPFSLSALTGAPEGRSRFYLIHLFQEAFAFQHMGYGATLAWLLFIVGLLTTLLLFWTSKFWVFYPGEGR